MRAPEPYEPATLAVSPDGGALARGEMLCLDVSPGQSARLAALLRNQSAIFDGYRLRVDGLPSWWWSIEPDRFSLVPASSSGASMQEVEIRVHPPPEAAGAKPVWEARVVARSRAYDRETASAPFTLDLRRNAAAPPHASGPRVQRDPATRRIDVSRLARRRAAAYEASLVIKYGGWIAGTTLVSLLWSWLAWPDGPLPVAAVACGILTAILCQPWSRALRLGDRRAGAGAAILAVDPLAIALYGLVTRQGLVAAVPFGLAGLVLARGAAAVFARQTALRRDGIEDDVPRWERDSRELTGERFATSPRLNPIPYLGSVVGGFIVALLSPGLGVTVASRGLSAQRARRLAEKQAEALGVDELRGIDARPPILHLRSFADERIVVAGVARRHPFAKERLYLEDVMGEALWRYGPVVAASADRDPTPSLGAARASLSRDKWFARVEAWIGEADFISVTVGTTPSLLLEVSFVADVGAMQRTLLVMPPVRRFFARRARRLAAIRWEALRDALASTRRVVLPGSLDNGRVRVVIPGTAERDAVVITSRTAGDFCYGAALDEARAVLAQRQA